MALIPSMDSFVAGMTFGNEDTILKPVVSEAVNILPLVRLPEHYMASYSVRCKDLCRKQA